MRSYARRGITIVEALAAILLLGIGIAASIAAIGNIIKAETDVREREYVQRLAADMYEELFATGDYSQSPLSGDFQDRGVSGYTWESALEPSGIENLDTFSVTVTKTGSTIYNSTLSGLVFVPPVETGAGGALP